MSLRDILPYHWGEVCRYIESEMERTHVSSEERDEVMRALRVLLHAKPPSEHELQTKRVCCLCGRDPAAGMFVGAVPKKDDLQLWAAWRAADMPPWERDEVLFCWMCLGDRLGMWEPRLSRARAILLAAPGRDKHLPLFDKVVEQRLIREVSGTCALCRRRQRGLRGPPEKTICLSCVGRAQERYDAEQRSMREGAARRKAEYDRRVAAYLAEMWLVAHKDAEGAIRVLEKRGELRSEGAPEPGDKAAARGETASNAPPDGQGDAGEPVLPEGLIPEGTRFARAVMDGIKDGVKRVPLAQKAASWWRDARPTAVSLGWKLMEIAEQRLEATRTNTDSANSPAGPTQPPGGSPLGKPPIPRGNGPKDEAARAAILFLDEEVERAVRHQKNDGDLMGDSDRIRQACVALDEAALSRPMLRRFLQSISMLRQAHDLGVRFYDYTGDELIHEEIRSYSYLASRITIGAHTYAKTAVNGGLVVTGGTKEERARTAAAIERIVANWTLDALGRSQPFSFIEADNLYSMSTEAQEGVRRMMLITPPVVTVFGADDLDRFIEETPKRCSARIVTYLFMNGLPHLCLDDGLVHVGPEPPPGGPPQR